MIMPNVLNATQVRADFSRFVDTVVHEKPQVVKRNRDVFWSISHKMTEELLSAFSLAIEYEQEEDGTFVGSFIQLEDIIAYGNTFQAMLDDAARQLKEYAVDYYDDFTRYYNAPNRKAHLPFVLNVLIQEDLDGIKHLIRG